ncbi:hypothetical protein C043_01392 [Brucella abortus 80/101]|nr:hypothetical protein C043_01392 [Brucella abortus 80/101]
MALHPELVEGSKDEEKLDPCPDPSRRFHRKLRNLLRMRGRRCLALRSGGNEHNHLGKIMFPKG